MSTLVPVHQLLSDVSGRLERYVRPHVDGMVFAEISDALDILQALARLGVVDVEERVDVPEAQREPEYCEAHECQNRPQLCLSHAFGIHGAVIR